MATFTASIVRGIVRPAACCPPTAVFISTLINTCAFPTSTLKLFSPSELIRWCVQGRFKVSQGRPSSLQHGEESRNNTVCVCVCVVRKAVKKWSTFAAQQMSAMRLSAYCVRVLLSSAAGGVVD